MTISRRAFRVGCGGAVVLTSNLSSCVAMFLAVCAPVQARQVVVGTGGYADLGAAIADVPRLRTGLPDGEPVEIVMGTGNWRLNQPVVIDALHGGTATHRLILRGAGPQASRLLGSVAVKGRPATPADAGGKPLPQGTLAVDFSALSMPGTLVRRGLYVGPQQAGIEIYQGTARLAPSRWPATGYAATSGSGTHDQARFTVPPAKAAQWAGEKALWAGGFWGTEWSYEFEPVLGVDAASGTARLAPLADQSHIRPRSRFFIANALSELSRPGSFYVDPARKLALVVPVAGGGDIEMAVAPSLLVLNGAQDVSVEGIGFDRVLGEAVVVNGGQHVSFLHCAFRQTGGQGLSVQGGRDVTVSGSVVSSTGEGGVDLVGGDRPTLSPAGHWFTDGIITDFGIEGGTYRPGIHIAGVGNGVRGSWISGGDHNAVVLSGNDLQVVGNEIDHVLRDADDAGAVYMGNDWSQRGFRIIGNYIHDLGTGRPTSMVSGIYLDDQLSGALVSGNVVVGGAFGVLLGGGRDNRIEGNLLVGQRMGGVSFDQRGVTFQQHALPDFRRRLNAMPWQGALWQAHYPALAALGPDQMGQAGGDVAQGNMVLGQRGLYAPDAATGKLLGWSGNTVRPTAPGDAGALAHLLPAGAPALAMRAAALSGLAAWRGVPPAQR